MKKTLIGLFLLTSLGLGALFQNFISPDSAFLEARNTRFKGYDIIIVAGQSNAVGAGNWTETMPKDPMKKFGYDEKIFQVSRYLPDVKNEQLSLINATETLSHFGFRPNKKAIGFGMTFARHYAAGMGKTRKIILVPAAMGGTSIDEWLGTIPVTDQYANREVKLFDDLVKRVKFALNVKGPNDSALNNRVVALLWQHGEADIRKMALQLGGMNSHVYLKKMKLLFARLKNKLPETERNFSIVIGAPVPTWEFLPDGTTSVTAAKEEFKNELLAYTQKSLKTIYVDTSTVTPILRSNCDIHAGDDCVHYNALSQIKLGRLHYEAFINTFAGLRITN